MTTTSANKASDRMMRKLSKRETILTGLVLAILAARPWFPYLSPQFRNLRKVREHIATIQPEWTKFLSDHPGCQLVGLFPYSGKDGLLGVSGEVASTNDLDALKGFLKQTEPPRPIQMFVRVSNRNLDDYQILVEARKAERYEEQTWTPPMLHQSRFSEHPAQRNGHP